jgi:hypothetical protein
MSEKRQRGPGPAPVDAAIAEIVEQLVELGEATRDCATMLGALVGELRELLAERGPAAIEADGTPPIAPEVLEVARLQAHATGVTVPEYLRDAVHAYARQDSDGPATADGDPRGRARAARREAAPVRAERKAVSGQSTQALAHSRAVVRRPKRDDA